MVALPLNYEEDVAILLHALAESNARAVAAFIQSLKQEEPTQRNDQERLNTGPNGGKLTPAPITVHGTHGTGGGDSGGKRLT